MVRRNTRESRDLLIGIWKWKKVFLFVLFFEPENPVLQSINILKLIISIDKLVFLVNTSGASAIIQ